jgi:hypothetical protein
MAEEQKPTCCCSCSAPDDSNAAWVTGKVDADAGPVSTVATNLTMADKFGWWRVRWAIGRSKFRVAPGLYAVGNPIAGSHVFVSANFKLSFDHLRRSLVGVDGWILVLDTDGINVWCAAGKKTFGTEELLERIKVVDLQKIVGNATLILPQLGASGIASHVVRKETGFKVVYGPVRAEDIPAFLESDMKATQKMRRVRFGLLDRLVLTPVELVISFKYVLLGALLCFFLAGLTVKGFVLDAAMEKGLGPVIMVIGAWFAGAVVGPLLLPFLPGRSFSSKGAAAGLLVSAMLLLAGSAKGLPPISIVAWLLIVSAVSSFIVMNFTGSSTYASPSGVRKEMTKAVPIQALSSVVGIVLWITSLIMK